MKTITPWEIQLITPNQYEAEAEVSRWIAKGYGTQFSKFKKQVMTKKAGPQQLLYFVKTRTKP
jgi:hypothetical protein